MTDHPIIYSTPMVKALLHGRKTVTRRLAWREIDGDKPVPANAVVKEMVIGGRRVVTGAVPTLWQRVKPGDRLWVRERGWLSVSGGAFLPFVGNELSIRRPPTSPNSKPYKNCVSIHMPRWASRLTLTVTATRIERLQAITEADAMAEGIHLDPLDGHFGCDGQYRPRASHEFANLWRSLHGPDSWDANPEVVVIGFTVEKRNIDAVPDMPTHNTSVDGAVVHGDEPLSPRSRKAVANIIGAARRQMRAGNKGG